MDDRTHALIISRDNFGTPEIKCKPNPDVINTNMAAKPMLEVPNVFIMMVDVEDKGGDLVVVVMVAAIAVVDAQAGLVQENNDESTERVQQSNGKVMHVRYNNDGFGSVDSSVRNGDIPMATDSPFRVVVVVVVAVVVESSSSLLLLTIEYRCG